MLERLIHDNGVVTYHSPLLRAVGKPHAFSTRLGGVSSGPYASLNLDRPRPGTDEAENITENFRRLRRAIGCEQHPWIDLKQVHGSNVWVVTNNVEQPPCADAIVTDQPDKLLAIRVADCAAVLLSDTAGTTVAAIHVGWRGLIAGVVPSALRQLGEGMGLHPGQLVAAVGPCITQRHFEVGPEVSEAIERIGLGSSFSHAFGSRAYVDLAGAVETQLQRGGLVPSRIDRTDRCTYRDADEFFSHRRDRGITGRMAAVIAK